MENRLAESQRVIGYHFANSDLLEVALRHSSLRTLEKECNERLEFLGDSVLGLVITEELYRLLPDQAEGELTRIKSAVVARGALYRASQKLGLARFAEFARGVGRRDELPVSVTANLVEAVIGAIYLDAGFFPAREFVLRHLGHEIDETLNDRGAKNYKSLLQHEAQQAVGATPTWRTIDEGGADHRRGFTVATMIRGREWGRATGATKKEAEQEAARIALEAWERRGQSRRRRHAEEHRHPEEQKADARGERRPFARDEAGPPSRSESRSEPRPPAGAWEEPEADDFAPEAPPPERPSEARRDAPAREPARELPPEPEAEPVPGRRRRRRFEAAPESAPEGVSEPAAVPSRGVPPRADPPREEPVPRPPPPREPVAAEPQPRAARPAPPPRPPAQPPPPRSAPVPREAPPPRDEQRRPAAPDFAQGLEVAAPAGPPPRGSLRRDDVQTTRAERLAPRKRAPAAPKPPPADSGFDAGL